MGRMTLFSQGDRAAEPSSSSRTGKIKITVLSQQGKQAVIALLGPGDFFGEGCLAGQPLRMATATAMTDSSIVRLAKADDDPRVHKDQPPFAEMFTTYLLLATSGWKRIWSISSSTPARSGWPGSSLLLANFGKEGRPETVVPKISQETLAEMVGTTRSRISHFMNKFRKLGFVDYNGGPEGPLRAAGRSSATTEREAAGVLARGRIPRWEGQDPAEAGRRVPATLTLVCAAAPMGAAAPS